eukprot:Unigene2575_Nuclearia_a/m.7941 Unigene2575_Nuclearia_a/g.7941  ORF Unigene2575_Nuclearia_a/g.7941 Unigene2575_Nuclearia_a/m.7941 type:complete len:329 (+) Unigene2575_Nuclearia_a:559-1545(+)
MDADRRLRCRVRVSQRPQRGRDHGQRHALFRQRHPLVQPLRRHVRVAVLECHCMRRNEWRQPLHLRHYHQYCQRQLHGHERSHHHRHALRPPGRHGRQRLTACFLLLMLGRDNAVMCAADDVHVTTRRNQPLRIHNVAVWQHACGGRSGGEPSRHAQLHRNDLQHDVTVHDQRPECWRLRHRSRSVGHNARRFSAHGRDHGPAVHLQLPHLQHLRALRHTLQQRRPAARREPRHLDRAKLPPRRRIDGAIERRRSVHLQLLRRGQPGRSALLYADADVHGNLLAHENGHVDFHAHAHAVSNSELHTVGNLHAHAHTVGHRKLHTVGHS